MAKTEVRHPDKIVSTGSYSAGVLIDGWLFISGHGPIDMRTGKVVPGTIEEETRLTLSHLDLVLKAAGCTLQDVVKCTVHLADIKDFDRFDKAYSEFFHGIRPARTTVQSVLWGGIKVEVDAIARVVDDSIKTH